MFGGPGISNSWTREAESAKKPDVERHYPYVRPLQLEWQELPTGFRARASDERRFEVICAACGDIDGPAHYQSASVQALRGPHDTKKLAEKIARTHEHGTRVALGRGGGGTREAMRYFFPIRAPRIPGR
jgi:hypothetical protein